MLSRFAAVSPELLVFPNMNACFKQAICASPGFLHCDRLASRQPIFFCGQPTGMYFLRRIIR